MAIFRIFIVVSKSKSGKIEMYFLTVICSDTYSLLIITISVLISYEHSFLFARHYVFWLAKIGCKINVCLKKKHSSAMNCISSHIEQKQKKDQYLEAFFIVSRSCNPLNTVTFLENNFFFKTKKEKGLVWKKLP